MIDDEVYDKREIDGDDLTALQRVDQAPEFVKVIRFFPHRITDDMCVVLGCFTPRQGRAAQKGIELDIYCYQ